nr:peptidoglycan-binding domain-containing protein [Planosporangium thailandense]
MSISGTASAQPSSFGVVPAGSTSCNSTTHVYDPLLGWHHNIPTVGSGSSNHNCVLGIGNQGSAVVALQQNLNIRYNSGLVVDGDYGSNTANAVRRVQAILGIAQDGVYGPQTCSRMSWYFEESPSNSGTWHC